MYNNLIDTISISTVDTKGATTVTYFLAFYIPDQKDKFVMDPLYNYYSLLDVNNNGLLLKVRKMFYARELDFVVYDIESRNNINKNNRKFFMKGVFLGDSRKFKDLKTGSQFNQKLLEANQDTLLVKKILDMVSSLTFITY
jgi:hypothetical protein